MDDAGLIIFLVPYSDQVRTRELNLARAILPTGFSLKAVVGRPFSHQPIVLGGPRAVSVIYQIQRTDQTRYLIVTARQASSMPDRSADAGCGIVDSSDNLLMYSGDETLIAPGSTIETEATVIPISSLPGYRAVVRTRAPQIKGFFVFSWTGISLTLLAFLSCSAWASRRLVLWIGRLQWKLNRMQGHLLEDAQQLAHDFQTPILNLRTLTTDLTGKLSLEQLQRLSAAVTDMSGFADQLATDFVREAFESLDGSALREAKGHTGAGTYLRGTLETIAQDQGTGFGHKIAVLFATIPPVKEPFVDISRAALTRIVSNLLKNSIDACRVAGTDNITIRVIPEHEATLVQIIDNGCGIPDAHREHIFEPTFSTKGERRGKGLASALDLAKAWNATIETSAPESGTGSIFELRLKNRETPSWFVNAIKLSDKTVLVVVDDEGEVFEYWRKTLSARLEGINLPEERRPRLVGLRSAAELRENRDQALEQGTLFLIDYSFKNDEITGTQLIEELRLERNAILVTNFIEQRDVLSAVERLGIRMLPKVYLLNSKFPIDIGGGDD
jgi:signal transduction histidine kinase